MSEAMRCDRCGKFYEPYYGVKLQPTTNPYNTVRFENKFLGRDFDMCPDCMEKVIEFMKAGKDAEND